MRFVLYDDVLEQTPDRIVVIKQVSSTEEYLADHFPGFAIFPGVMMVESVIQAARRLLIDRGGPHVLAEARGLRFGTVVRPGHALEIEVTLQKELPGDCFACRGVGKVRRSGGEAVADETAVTGRFTMRPLTRSVPI